MANETDNTPSHPSDREGPAYLQPLLEGFRGLYVSKEFSDLTITCQGHHFELHRLWVCAQSDFFLAALGGVFKEAKECKISLDDDDPQVIEAFL